MLAMLTRKQYRTSAFHQRAAERSRRSALLRRDEGRARPALEVRHPPPDHGARGTRLHPPPAQSRPRDRGDQAARACRASGSGGRRGFTPSVIEGTLGKRPQRRVAEDDGGRPVAVPVMGRIAAGTPIEAIADPQPHHQRAARHARHRRALRARSARRLDDRRRHPRRRHGADQAQRRPPTPATSSWR